MPPMPIIDAKKLIKFLKFKGYILIRQKGSHCRYCNEFGKCVTIPVHKKKSIKRGLLKNILDEIGSSVDELVDFLE